MFFLINPYVIPKNLKLFRICFFIIYISYTIHLLINSYLILDKHSVDLVLVYCLLISLQLFCFCMESLSLLFYHCSHHYICSFFLYVILPFKFLIFSFLFISPLWWHSKMFMCFFTPFFGTLILLFHQGSDSLLFLLSQALRPILFPT